MSQQPGRDFESCVVTVGQRSRRMLIFRPDTCIEEPAPAVLAFHGAGSCAEQMIDFTNLAACAEQHGFVAVFPNGTGRTEQSCSWNAGSGNVYAVRRQVDDLSFAQRIIDTLVGQYAIDPQRVYAAGMSNGGLLCYVLAAHMPDRIAAVAAVGCSMLHEQDLRPRGKIPVIHFHGTADRFVPFAGGIGDHSFTRSRFLPVRQTVELWATVNQCEFPPRELSPLKPATDSADHETWVQTLVYENPKFGPEVRWITVHGGGHTWPGQLSTIGYLGRSTLLIDANQLIWNFCGRYRLS